MQRRKFVLILIHVYHLHVRFIDEPRQSDTNADEAVNGAAHSPEQGRGATGNANRLYRADGAVT